MNAPIVTTPERGIVFGMSNAAYHAHPAISKSQLADFMVVPANYYGLHLDPNRPPREEKPGQRAGTLLHTLVLEPDTFDERYRIGPNVTRSTKEWKSFEATLRDGITALKPGEHLEGMRQARSLRAHPEVAELLSSGVAEASVFWTDQKTGLACRCRPDWLHETPHGWIVLDLKTGPADAWAFGSQVSRMTYEVQEAMYSEGIEIATGKPVLAFVFGVVETSPPYLSSCNQIDEIGRASGRVKYRNTLDYFAECRAKDEWPGYRGVQLVSLPRYAIESTE